MFYLNKRYFSHGCMRVEKPVELAEILLEENASVLDTLIQSCLLHQKPRTLPVAKPLSLVVLYSSGWYTENGEIKFFEDVYHKR
jgi:murein L,D-transpeptidase YcbB/YkuD